MGPFCAMHPPPAPPRRAQTASDAGARDTTRRLQPRNALRCVVTIAIAGGNERCGTTVDLSHDGLSLSTDKPIAPGTRCTLRLQTPRAAGAEPLRIDVKAVYSSYTGPGNFKIGMVFLGLETRVADALRALSVPSTPGTSNTPV